MCVVQFELRCCGHCLRKYGKLFSRGHPERSCNKIANGSHVLIVVLRRSQNLTSSRQISLSVYLNSERISDWREQRGAVS